MTFETSHKILQSINKLSPFMFSIFFVFVCTTILILVQNVDSAESKTDINSLRKNAFSQSKPHSLRDFVSNKNDVSKYGFLLRNMLRGKTQEKSKMRSKADPTLRQLKQVLSKFLVKHNEVSNKRNARSKVVVRSPYRMYQFGDIEKFTSRGKIKPKRSEEAWMLENQLQKKEAPTPEPKWRNWSEWSNCSVTCGKGRVIRWRHCKENCGDVETEMQEKACQLPACQNKLFGVIKL